MIGTTDLPSGGVLHVRVTDGLTLEAGNWQLDVAQAQRQIVRITPPEVPMFQQVVEYLEAKPVPRGGNMRRADEARAVTAVCVRWGSYFAVLADPVRPPAPNIDDEQVSQIDDSEMARMNIEISAALAWWFTLCGSDESRYWDLVHRALAYLPSGPKTVTASQAADALLACSTAVMAADVRRNWPADRLKQDLAIAANHGIRIVANAVTLRAWRNGPIEGAHAGRYMGHGLAEQRVMPREERAVVRQAQAVLYGALKVVDYLRYDGPWSPPAERVLPFLHPLIHPARWTCTELSRNVEFLLRQDGR